MTVLTWISPPDCLHLENSAVHIWRVIHPVEGKAIGSQMNILSLEERRRAERFHKRFDADRFILHHAILREILSSYLSLDPAVIKFNTSPIGKPRLTEKQNHQQIKFNLSHSGEILLIALSLKREIGIDIELIKPIPDMNRMVELYFSKSENDTYASLPQSERALAFYSAWTRKEAYLKSIGEGLQHPPDQVEVSLDPCEPSPKLKLLDRGISQTTHQLLSFQPAQGYQAAVALEGKFLDVLAIKYGNSLKQLPN